MCRIKDEKSRAEDEEYILLDLLFLSKHGIMVEPNKLKKNVCKFYFSTLLVVIFFFNFLMINWEIYIL